MIGRKTKAIYRDGDSVRIGLPKVWVEALGLKPGDRVEAFFDEILVLVPRKSAQSERVLRAMREGQ